MVKISDPDAGKKYGIVNTPSLVYFRKKMPLIYDGNCSVNELNIIFIKILTVTIKSRYCRRFV